MDSELKIKQTPMQRLKESIYQSKEMLSKQEQYTDFDFRIHLDVVVSLLDNYFSVEVLRLSDAFDYGYLQAELKEMADVTNGSEYVKKYYRKSESISSKI